MGLAAPGQFFRYNAASPGGRSLIRRDAREEPIRRDEFLQIVWGRGPDAVVSTKPWLCVLITANEPALLERAGVSLLWSAQRCCGLERVC